MRRPTALNAAASAAFAALYIAALAARDAVTGERTAAAALAPGPPLLHCTLLAVVCASIGWLLPLPLPLPLAAAGTAELQQQQQRLLLQQLLAAERDEGEGAPHTQRSVRVGVGGRDRDDDNFERTAVAAESAERGAARGARRGGAVSADADGGGIAAAAAVPTPSPALLDRIASWRTGFSYAAVPTADKEG